ncbi:MAG: hypothetical protein Q9219_001029 [cf. Caloplaca sp. 3 TL-2023]
MGDMNNFQVFEDLFAFAPDYAYGEQTINKILKCRRSMENELFIDRLLKTLGIEQAIKLYPPRSNQDLRDLHQQIIDSPSPDHHKHSVLYYILKDVTNKDTQPSSMFAKAVYLPPRYRIFMDGLWYLDRGKFAKALDYLTEPVLIPTFPEEIIYTLCTHPEQQDDMLPLAYYHTVSPAITSRKVLEAFFSVLVRASVTDAFFWARKQGEVNHRNLFEQLVHAILDEVEGEDRARRSVELIYLPFGREEEIWFETYLASEKGRDRSGAEDMLGVRKMVTGRAGASVGQSQGSGGKTTGGTGWSSLASSYEKV